MFSADSRHQRLETVYVRVQVPIIISVGCRCAVTPTTSRGVENFIRNVRKLIPVPSLQHAPSVLVTLVLGVPRSSTLTKFVVATSSAERNLRIHGARGWVGCGAPMVNGDA